MCAKLFDLFNDYIDCANTTKYSLFKHQRMTDVVTVVGSNKSKEVGCLLASFPRRANKTGHLHSNACKNPSNLNLNPETSVLYVQKAQIQISYLLGTN